MTTPTNFKAGPLAGLRVIELGTLLAGPFCGQLLGDFGAEVIKVEPPGQGDPMRVWGREKANGKSLWWPVVARNKKAITLDLRQAEGQQILKDLVAKSDFLLENFRPGTMEKWGLGWDVLSAINPKLIMIRVSGFGQTGPYSRQAGFGAIGEAMGGLRYVVGDPTTPPSRMACEICSSNSSMPSVSSTRIGWMPLAINFLIAEPPIAITYTATQPSRKSTLAPSLSSLPSIASSANSATPTSVALSGVTS